MGWKTQQDTKNIMVSHARHMIWNRNVQIRSKVLWEEMLDFIQDFTETGMTRYRAFRGHDDAVMAWMIALTTSSDEDFKKYQDIEERQSTQVMQKLPEAAFYDSKGLNRSHNSELLDEIGDWK